MINKNWQPIWLEENKRCSLEISDYDKLQLKHKKASKHIAIMKNNLKQYEETITKLLGECKDKDKQIKDLQTQIKKQQMARNIEWDIIASLMELKGVIEDD